MLALTPMISPVVGMRKPAPVPTPATELSTSVLMMSETIGSAMPYREVTAMIDRCIGNYAAVGFLVGGVAFRARFLGGTAVTSSRLVSI